MGSHVIPALQQRLPCSILSPLLALDGKKTLQEINRSDLINSICSLNLGPNPNKYFNLGERQDPAYLEGHHQMYRKLHVLSCSPRERHPVIFFAPPSLSWFMANQPVNATDTCPRAIACGFSAAEGFSDIQSGYFLP
jgi:hypothetical protein